MAYTPLQISIPSPCSQPWGEMTPVTANKRHCDSCAKQVTDFSWMTDREIHAYLQVAGNTLCGRFRADQLDRPIRARIAPSKSWRALATAGGLLLSAGVAAQAPAEAVNQLPTLPLTEQTLNTAVPNTSPTPRPFHGRVFDDSGETLIGASILVEGADKGTVTDLDGRFTLMVSPGSILRIDYTGYESRTITVQESHLAAKDIEIELILSTALLGEVIVVGGIAPTTVGDYTDDIEPDTVKDEAGGLLRSVRINPNPFTDRLNVSFRAGDAGAVKATLHTVKGPVVRTWPEYRFAAGMVKFDLPLGTTDVPTGSYILRLLNQSEVLYSAVVIKK